MKTVHAAAAARRVTVWLAGVMVALCWAARPAAAAPIDCFSGAPLTLNVLIGLGSDGCARGGWRLFDWQ